MVRGGGGGGGGLMLFQGGGGTPMAGDEGNGGPAARVGRPEVRADHEGGNDGIGFSFQGRWQRSDRPTQSRGRGGCGWCSSLARDGERRGQKASGDGATPLLNQRGGGGEEGGSRCWVPRSKWGKGSPSVLSTSNSVVRMARARQRRARAARRARARPDAETGESGG
jgi:hypothetical protein